MFPFTFQYVHDFLSHLFWTASIMCPYLTESSVQDSFNVCSQTHFFLASLVAAVVYSCTGLLQGNKKKKSLFSPAAL